MPYKQSLGLWEENINRNTIYLLLITQRCSQALWSRSAAPTWAEHQHTARALGSVWLRCVPVGTGICQVQTLVQLGTATHTSLLQFKPYTLAEHFNQGKSHGNVLLPPPSPDCCVCKQKPLKGLICPLSLLSTQTHWAQGAQLTLFSPFPYQARGSMGVSSHHLHRSKKHIPLSCFLPNASYFINTLVSNSEDFTGQNTLTHQSKTLQAAHK